MKTRRVPHSAFHGPRGSLANCLLPGARCPRFAPVSSALTWVHIRSAYGVTDLITSSPFIETVTMSLLSRFIFVRSTMRIWLFS